MFAPLILPLIDPSHFVGAFSSRSQHALMPCLKIGWALHVASFWTNVQAMVDLIQVAAINSVMWGFGSDRVQRRHMKLSFTGAWVEQ